MVYQTLGAQASAMAFRALESCRKSVAAPQKSIKHKMGAAYTSGLSPALCNVKLVNCITFGCNINSWNKMCVFWGLFCLCQVSQCFLSLICHYGRCMSNNSVQAHAPHQNLFPLALSVPIGASIIYPEFSAVVLVDINKWKTCQCYHWSTWPG